MAGHESHRGVGIPIPAGLGIGERCKRFKPPQTLEWNGPRELADNGEGACVELACRSGDVDIVVAFLKDDETVKASLAWQASMKKGAAACGIGVKIGGQHWGIDIG